MKKPPSYVDNPNQVCKLRKYLYGLKQVARQWNQKLKSDNCAYVKNKNGKITLFGFYVDDCLIICDKKEVNVVKELLEREFIVSYLGDVQKFLNLRITRNREERKLKIDQSHYIKNVLKRFQMDKCKHVKTPQVMSSKKTFQNITQEENAKFPYRVVGCLMYAMLGNCLDISALVNYVSR